MYKRKRLEIKDDLLHYLQYLLYLGILRHFQTLYHQCINKFIFSVAPETQQMAVKRPFDTHLDFWVC